MARTMHSAQRRPDSRPSPRGVARLLGPIRSGCGVRNAALTGVPVMIGQPGMRWAAAGRPMATALKPAQQSRDAPRDGIGFMQHHGNATPARRQDRGGSDSPRGEHRIDGFTLDHPAHADAGPEQADQLHQFLEATALEATRLHRDQTGSARHQARPSRSGTPTQRRPIGCNGFCTRGPGRGDHRFRWADQEPIMGADVSDDAP